MMQHIRGKEVPVEVSLLTEYDNYYISLKNALPLPVYKIKVRDADKSCYYLDPVDGSCRYFNENTRYRVWMYKGLHCFSTVFFCPAPHAKGCFDVDLAIGWMRLVGDRSDPLNSLCES